MNREELYNEIKSGDLSPVDLQGLRDDIRKHTGKYVPRRRTEIIEWYEDNRLALTQALKPGEDDDGDEDDVNKDDNTDTTQQTED